MKFKIDENLPVEVADLLRRSGHDATTVLEEELGGSSDVEIASICRQESRALITLDADFANIRAYPPNQHHGLVVLRLRIQSKPSIMEALQRLVPSLFSEPLNQRLWIVEADRIRIRS